jgi:hypothetical protein
MKTCNDMQIHPHAVVTWDAIYMGEKCPLCNPVCNPDSDEITELKKTFKGCLETVQEVSNKCQEAADNCSSLKTYCEEAIDACDRVSDKIECLINDS